MVDDDYDEVVDAVLLWWRDGDGDLVDALVDASFSLAGGGTVWLLTPKIGRAGARRPGRHRRLRADCRAVDHDQPRRGARLVRHPPRRPALAPVTVEPHPRPLQPGDRRRRTSRSPTSGWWSTRRSDFLGRNLLIVFFPLTFTPVCGGELTRLRDELPDFVGPDRALVAISTDTSAVHRAYDEREFVGYPAAVGLLAARRGRRARTACSTNGPGSPLRGTFLVDDAGIVRWSTVNVIPDARSTDEYRAALAALSRVRHRIVIPAGPGSV